MEVMGLLAEDVERRTKELLQLCAGGAMKARFAVSLEFQDGKIVRQRNYDCFEPW
jgi:ketosteroid isomerase-like protein